MNRTLQTLCCAAASTLLLGTAQAASPTLFGNQAAFLAALGATPTQTQNFEGYAPGTNLIGVQVLPGVTIGTNLAQLEVFQSIGPNRVAFASDRNQPEAIYNIRLGAGYLAFGFEITGFDPATPGPGFLDFIFADGDTTYTGIPVLPTNPTESTPLFFGIISDVPVLGIRWSEGPETNGIDCCEETGLDNFIAANPVPEPGTYGLMALGLAMLGAALRQRGNVQV
jgi:hypothetical protein